MSLSRPLLPLCGLLLALAVTAVSAAAPLYGTDDVVLSYFITPAATTQAAQVAHCAAHSGAIVPMVTDAIYTRMREILDAAGATTFIAYAGGSTILSTSACTTQQATLSCIWYWDQGRYATIANAANFFIGNRDPKYLTGASMISTAVANYWRLVGTNERCPCDQMERYLTLLRTNGGSPFWTDSSSITYSYGTQAVGLYRTLCAIETLTTTTTTAEPSKKDSSVNLPLVIGLSVGVGIALFITIAVIVSLVCCGGCSCLAGSPAVAATSATHNAAQLEYDGELQAALSRRESMSRAGSYGAHLMGMDDMGNRSFHDGPMRKQSTGHYSSARGFADDAEPWQNGEEMAGFATPQYMPSYSSASMGAAPPSGPGTMPPQMMPDQMMHQQPMPPQMMPQQPMPPQMMPQQPMPPQMMPQQPMPRNGSQTW